MKNQEKKENKRVQYKNNGIMNNKKWYITAYELIQLKVHSSKN